MNISAIRGKMAILKILLTLCLLIQRDFCYFVTGQTPRFCSFDNGLCGFVNDQSGTDDFDWTRLNNAAETVTKFRIVKTSVPFGFFQWHRYYHPRRHRFRYVTKRVPYQAVVRGPQRDHTTGRGFYVYAKPRVENAQAGNLARFVSPVYTNVSCLQFYYFMHGNDIGGLEVLVKLGNNIPIKVWSQFGSVANAWKLAKIPVNAHGNQTVKMYFQAIVGESNRASVGIDDVNILSDQCTFYPTTAKPKEIIMDGNGGCTFDHTLCSYQNSNNDDFDWKRVNVGTMISTAGPTKDHTTSLGSYVHAEGATRGSKARLVSPPLYNTSCVSFYYFMFGSQIGTLNVYIIMLGNSTRLLQLTGNQGNRWYKSQLVLGQDDLKTTYKVVFEAINGDGFSGGIAIDDISVLHSPCWSQLPTSGPSIRSTTALPFKDGSIRLVNGQTNYEGRVEVFHSGVWGTVCDDLWDMPDANVVCKMLGFPGAVRTTKSHVYGRGVGTIWLDDVNCKGSEASIAQCRHGGWGNNNCDHYEDAGVICRLDLNTTSTGDCSFEYDMCGYQNGDRTNSEFDWTRKRGPTPSAGTGPQSDQSRKGYYMYTEVSQGDTGARAKLTSPVLPVNTKCMSFYYHMRGSGIGWLNVYMKKENTHTTVKLWTLSGAIGNSWLQGKVPINVTGGEGFKVIFEGVRGNSESGDIAIDTISVSNTSCPMKPAKAKPIPALNALEGQVRLVGDPNPLRGRVEIFHSGQWGTICNNMWSDEDATVVCKMLGYSGLGRIGSTLNRTPGVVPIWLDNLQCTGGESTLLQCPKNPWGRHNCDHSKDSWVLCSNGTFDDECSRYKILNDARRVRTFFGQVNECDRNSGIFPGQWHRFMGPAGNQMASSCVPENRCGTRAPGWLNGDHPTIKEGMVTRRVCFSFFGDCCKWSTSVRVKNCSGFYVYELQKPPTCKLRYCGNGTETRIRLAGSMNNYSGRVEVLHNGEWGTVCDDLWDIDDATVACRMLGFPGASTTKTGGKFGQGISTMPIWLDDLQCTGNENNLAFCKHAGWGKSNCGHQKDAGVICISEKCKST